MLLLYRGICIRVAVKAMGSGFNLLCIRDSLDREKSVWNVVERTRTVVETKLWEILELGICARSNCYICSTNWMVTSYGYFYGIWAVRARQQPSCPNIMAWLLNLYRHDLRQIIHGFWFCYRTLFLHTYLQPLSFEMYIFWRSHHWQPPSFFAETTHKPAYNLHWFRPRSHPIFIQIHKYLFVVQTSTSRTLATDVHSWHIPTEYECTIRVKLSHNFSCITTILS